MKISSCSGVGVVDVVVALAIVGMVYIVAIPSAAGMLQRAVLRKESEALHQLIDRLPALASRYGREARLLTEPKRYTVVLEDGRLLLQHTLPEGVALTIGGETTASLAAYPSGAVSPATVEITRGGYRCRFTISLRARITKVCSSINR